MGVFRWLRGKKSSLPKPTNPKNDKTDHGTSAAENAEAVHMLERMISEEPDNSGFDLDKLRESVVVGQRHAQMLRRMGSSLIPGLSRALDHANSRIKEKGCWSLQILGSSSGLPDEALHAMAGLISDNDQTVRQQAVSSLGALSPEVNLTAVLPQIVAALKSSDGKVRKSIAEMLGKMGANAAAVLTPCTCCSMTRMSMLAKSRDTRSPNRSLRKCLSTCA